MPDKLTTNTKGNGSGHNGREYPSPTCPIITYKQTISIKASDLMWPSNVMPFLLNKYCVYERQQMLLVAKQIRADAPYYHNYITSKTRVYNRWIHEVILRLALVEICLDQTALKLTVNTYKTP